MFGDVCALHGEMFGTTFLPREIPKEKRSEILLQVVDKLAENMWALKGEEKPCNLGIKSIVGEHVPSAGFEHGKRIIYIPSIWLKEFSELFPKGASLEKKHPDEPFKPYANRLYRLALQEKDPSIAKKNSFGVISRRIFKFHLRNLQDGQKAQQIIAFAISHELAHLMNKDHLLDVNFLMDIVIKAQLVTIASLPVFYNLGLRGPHLIIAAKISGLAFGLWLKNAKEKQRERDADLIALRACPETKEGAILFFENGARLEIKNEVINKSHTPAQDRIAYLKAAGQ